MVEPVHRATLPINEPRRPAATPLDVRDARQPAPIQPLRPPAQAPNVLVILLDDMGFGASTPFGGPCRMPVADRLAENGLRFSRFHTTAICSPTRASLLTGRNHHTVGMGGITEIATAFPGYNSLRPDSCATLPEILRQNGYSTAAFGKWHQTPQWETSRSGPFDRWPTGEGFERFYGFMGAETDHWSPSLHEGTTPIDTPDKPGYHLSEDLADRCIADIREQQTITPDKPFFAYLSFGALHTPHHVPRSYIDACRGQFDHGWDEQRTRTFARQKELGIVPPDAELTPRPDAMPAWADKSEDERRLYARLMEAYAAMATHTDEQVGRVVDALENLEILDNTVVLYILGDNGAAAEAGLDGCVNHRTALNQASETVAEMLERIEDIGGPDSFNSYPVPWAHAMNTPFQWTKQIASHWGGTRNGMIVHWPAGIESASRGGIREQFTHVNDIAPTLLELSDIPEPSMVNGISQRPMEGESFAYTLNDADAPERHTTQYFEVFGNRGIYHDGWSACTKHGLPWMLLGETPRFTDDVWELYAPGDYAQAHDLAAQCPDKLRELQDLFLIEGAKYHVFPLDDRKAARTNAAASGRPHLAAGRDRVTLYPGMRHLGEGVVPDTKNRSWSATARIVVGAESARGAIIAQGGKFGGWSLYLHEGRPAFTYNFLARASYAIESQDVLAPGEHELRYEFDYEGGGVGRGGTGRLLVDGKEVGQTRIERTIPFLYGYTSWMDIGRDEGAPVTDRYGTDRGVFTGGTIDHVVLATGDDAITDPRGEVEATLSVQ
ncbi:MULTISPECIES: arylsulfatase [unclassified Streptomyces]|uniref:arylsulfatase n=1 Tax=unclassified Streptomyces TaxID=2593676 RepID=UPI0035DC0178